MYVLCVCVCVYVCVCVCVCVYIVPGSSARETGQSSRARGGSSLLSRALPARCSRRQRRLRGAFQRVPTSWLQIPRRQYLYFCTTSKQVLFVLVKQAPCSRNFSLTISTSESTCASDALSPYLYTHTQQQKKCTYIHTYSHVSIRSYTYE